MKRIIMGATFLAACLACALAGAEPLSITLPGETAELKASPLPGRVIALQKCFICHSVDYINMQPGTMTQAQWTAEVGKMQHAYGAPVSDDEVTQIGEYLATTYGTAKSIQIAAVSAASKPQAIASDKAAKKAAAPVLDAKALLNANGCLGCHAIDKKIVGPAYRDVAAHYRGNALALALLQASIHGGSTGKWGAVPMPAFAGLSKDELKTLAEFILKQ
jgi:cytochrome c551/c552